MYALGYILGYTFVFLVFASPAVALMVWACRKRPPVIYRNAPRKVRKQWNNITAIDPVQGLRWDPRLGKYV